MAKPRPKKLNQDALVSEALAASSAELPSKIAGYVSAGEVQRTSSGVSVVHIRQVHAGIPVHNAVRTVRFDGNGKLMKVSGSPAAIPQSAPTLPKFRAAEAVQESFVRLLGDGRIPPHLEFTAALPEAAASLPHPSCPTVLRKPPFADPIVANLVIEGRGKKARLLWRIALALPDGAGSYVVLVTATGGRRPKVVEVHRASSHAVSGDVFEYDPGSPATSVPFPRPRRSYPKFENRPLSGSKWVTGQQTSGNSTLAHGPTGSPVSATPNAGDLEFTPGAPGDHDQWTINAFYWCNVMHDFFEFLGFGEKAGNFQNANASGVAGGGDALLVVAKNSIVEGRAFFENRPDGTSPRMELGLLRNRHTALDADIVVHEFVHGVTSRVIGGKDAHTPLTEPQSLALGEGYSDYYAISIQNYFRRQSGQNEEWVYGAWIASRPRGLRTRSYDGYPNKYGFLKTGRKMEPHKAGEVWCATLLDLNRALAEELGNDRNEGDEAGWQLVFDSLSFIDLDEGGPHFLHARDAIYEAFDALVKSGGIPKRPAIRTRIEKVFADRGMGKNAASDGANLSSVKEGFK